MTEMWRFWQAGQHPSRLFRTSGVAHLRVSGSWGDAMSLRSCLVAGPERSEWRTLRPNHATTQGEIFRMKPTKKVVVALTVAIVSVIGIGVSYAAVGAWNKQTTGTGSAKAQTLTFTAVATVSPSESTNLYPGGSGGSVTATITNPNPYQITVNLVGSASSITATGGCSTTGAAFTPNASISVPVAANGGTATATLGNLTIDTDTPNACQGQTYTVTAPVTASQSGS